MVPDPKDCSYNFHLSDGIYFRRHGDLVSCMTCYEQKFKPLFDYAIKQR